VERGLRFIYSVASEPGALARWGHDLVFCFSSVSATSLNPDLRALAQRMGYERALEWRRLHPRPPRDNPASLSNFVFGTLAANALGVPGEPDRELVRDAAAGFPATGFLGFDPSREPPPADIPAECPRCALRNRRGAVRCERCGAALRFETRYEVWLDALILTYRGDVYGVKLGAGYADVLKWIEAMRPFPPLDYRPGRQSYYGAYAVTHVIYTLNDYGRYQLSRDWLPREFRYLEKNLRAPALHGDPETLGELMDTLRAFGVSEKDRIFQHAVDYELAHQNRDGGWGDPATDDPYTRFHSTWTAVDGLRESSSRATRLRRPELMEVLRPRSLLAARPSPGDDRRKLP